MIRRLVVIAALLFVVPLSAQTRHRVSRIEVRGNVPARIVVSQTALAEGRSYSDDDLDLAVARVRRLPFVHDARHSLEGETLVIEVTGVTRLFGDLDASGVGRESDQFSSAAVAGGGRLFLGSGVAEARVQEFVAERSDDNWAADVAYSQYGIGGTRLFATAGVNYAIKRQEGVEPDPSLRLLVGYPLSIRQTLTASAGDAGYSLRQPLLFLAARDLRGSFDSRALDLRWTYDTTEDPFFARRGLLITAGPSWSRSESDVDTLSVTFPGLQFVFGTLSTDTTSRSLSVDAGKLWTIGSRGAIFSGLSGAVTRTHSKTSFGNSLALGVDSRFQTRSGSATLGYAHNLFDRARATAMRQRIELAATYSRTDLENVAPFEPSDTTVTTVDLAYILRPQFATVRLHLSYVFQDEPPVATAPFPPIGLN